MKLVYRTLTMVFIVTLIFSCNSNVNDEFRGDIVGTWYTSGKKSVIEFYEKDGVFIGKIVDLKRPFFNGEPKKDFRNPDMKKRDNLIIGTEVFTGLEYDGNKTWDDGEYYDYQKGEYNSCEVKINKDGFLEIEVDGLERPIILKNKLNYQVF